MTTTVIALSTKTDLRQRVPDAAVCIPCPDHCENCAWQFVTPADAGYQAGAPLPATYEELPGAYRGHCGPVQPVRVPTLDGEEIGAIRNGSYFKADPTSVAFKRHQEAMGLISV